MEKELYELAKALQLLSKKIAYIEAREQQATNKFWQDNPKHFEQHLEISKRELDSILVSFQKS